MGCAPAARFHPPFASSFFAARPPSSSVPVGATCWVGAACERRGGRDGGRLFNISSGGDGNDSTLVAYDSTQLCLASLVGTLLVSPGAVDQPLSTSAPQQLPTRLFVQHTAFRTTYRTTRNLGIHSQLSSHNGPTSRLPGMVYQRSPVLGTQSRELAPLGLSSS